MKKKIYFDAFIELINNEQIADELLFSHITQKVKWSPSSLVQQCERLSVNIRAGNTLHGDD